MHWASGAESWSRYGSQGCCQDCGTAQQWNSGLYVHAWVRDLAKAIVDLSVSRVLSNANASAYDARKRLSCGVLHVEGCVTTRVGFSVLARWLRWAGGA